MSSTAHSVTSGPMERTQGESGWAEAGRGLWVRPMEHKDVLNAAGSKYSVNRLIFRHPIREAEMVPE